MMSKRPFNPARKIAGSLLGTGAAQPPPPPLPKVRIVTTPNTPPAATPPHCDLPPFEPLQRLDEAQQREAQIHRQYLSPNRSRKITRSASVVSLVPTGAVNVEGDEVMKMIFSPDGKQNAISKHVKCTAHCLPFEIGRLEILKLCHTCQCWSFKMHCMVTMIIVHSKIFFVD